MGSLAGVLARVTVHLEVSPAHRIRSLFWRQSHADRPRGGGGERDADGIVPRRNRPSALDPTG